MFGGNFEVAATQSQDEIARTFEATESGGIASKGMSQRIGLFNIGFKRSLPLIDDNLDLGSVRQILIRIVRIYETERRW